MSCLRPFQNQADKTEPQWPFLHTLRLGYVTHKGDSNVNGFDKKGFISPARLMLQACRAAGYFPKLDRFVYSFSICNT